MHDREDWSELHHLAYIYAAVASSDGAISNDELDVFCDKLHQWNAEIAADELMRIVMAAVAALGRDKESQDNSRLRESVELLARTLDDEGRAAALDDLLAIAAADGTLMPGEGSLLLEIRQAWGGDQPRARWRPRLGRRRS